MLKEGVDIDPGCLPTHLMTTDDYFDSVGKDVKWDIIFIDASHEKTQVLKDFNNSLEHLMASQPKMLLKLALGKTKNDNPCLL